MTFPENLLFCLIVRILRCVHDSFVSGARLCRLGGGSLLVYGYP
jgi:hypothetical protein